MSLRVDSRSWLIYDDEVLGAVMRALETAALSMTGQMLAKHAMKPVRAIGHFMWRVASSRTEEMIRNDGAQRVAVEKVAKMMNALAGKTPFDEAGMDELYAAVFRLDSRGQSAGTHGPGVHRAALRGD